MTHPFNQRYISKELTHFVGKGKEQEAQYQLLLTILRTCELRSDPNRTPGSPAVAWVTLNESFSERTMYHFPGVCFCDIPVADLPVHMEKYGPFGIAFPKAFLVNRGASPVFYIAKDSEIDPADNADAGIRQSSVTPYTRAVFFREMLGSLHRSSIDLLRAVSTVADSDGPKARELAELGKRVAQLRPYLDEYVFSYCVPFDSALDESHREHFYMEREWRVLGDVRFSLADVERLIVPRCYRTRFRADFPDCSGQVSYPI
jgi:hypothetical protein